SPIHATPASSFGAPSTPFQRRQPVRESTRGTKAREASREAGSRTCEETSRRAVGPRFARTDLAGGRRQAPPGGSRLAGGRRQAAARRLSISRWAPTGRRPAALD